MDDLSVNLLMTSTALFCAALCASLLQNSAFAAPALGQNSALSILDDIESLLLGPAYTLLPTQTQTPNTSPYPYTFSYATGSTAATILPTKTVTITEQEPVTITLTPKPTTVTEYITLVPSRSPLVSPGAQSPTSPIDKWEAPTPMKNFDSFNVLKYASGKDNMKIVSGIPAEASARPESPSKDKKSSPITKPYIPWDNSSSAIQIFYPEGTVDPAQDPVGGADFYASPIDLTDARNVSFTFSVFFPADFDWVLGGKLPGLYGGHDGCSGGNAALDCFSTRLMWRADGAGELYLYAPKDKQTKSLCEDPQSVCDAAYGLSIGRGAFYWEAGGWTTVTQTIYLNNPGQQDGEFTLDVNGVRKISRTDVFYRADLSGSGGDKGDDGKKKKATTTAKKPTKTTTTKKNDKPTTTSSTPTDIGDVLGPILGGLLGGLRRQEILDAPLSSATEDPLDNDNDGVSLPEATESPDMAEVTLGQPSTVLATGSASEDGISDADDMVTAESVKDTEVKFVGIFFSTFFGGHEDKYATPRDQYTWFKDFGLVYHS